MRNVAWAISNLCRGKPSPPFDLFESCIEVMCRTAMQNETEDILIDACWAISYISDSGL